MTQTKRKVIIENSVKKSTEITVKQIQETSLQKSTGNSYIFLTQQKNNNSPQNFYISPMIWEFSMYLTFIKEGKTPT